MTAEYELPPALVDVVAAAIWGVQHLDQLHAGDRPTAIADAEAALTAVVDATGGPDHIARFAPDRYALQHPITERFAMSLFDCTLDQELSALAGPPALGDHKVWSDEGQLRTEPVG